MSDDLSHAHAAGVHRDDFLVEARKPPLVFGDQVRIEGRLPISRHIQLYPSGVGNHRLLAVAVSAVAGLAVRKMMLYLRIQRPLGQRFLQIVQKAIRIKGRLGISATKKLIKNSIRDLAGSWVPCVGPWDSSSLPIVPKPHTKFRTVPTFSKNRDRLLEGDVAAKFMTAVLDQPRVKRLLSSDHFSVDGTLIEAWASIKSFKPKDGELPAPGGGGNRETDFHGQKRSNETHASTTDPEARLYRKGPGKEAKLCFMAHALMENRNGLVVDACLTEANGHAERIAALHMIEPRADRPTPITLGADKAYDAEDFVNELRSMNATPHVAQNTNGRSSAIDARTTRHVGYAMSQRIRKRIEEALGWIKTVAGQERTKLRGRERVGWAFTFAAAAYNLARLPKLMEAPA